MALSKQITKNIFGKEIVFDAAYIRVSHVSGGKRLLSVVADVLSAKGGPMIEQYSASFVPSLSAPSDFISQAYEHLKTLPEFADAVDC